VSTTIETAPANIRRSRLRRFSSGRAISIPWPAGVNAARSDCGRFDAIVVTDLSDDIASFMMESSPIARAYRSDAEGPAQDILNSEA